MELVAPGGQLVYSVCTVTPQETIEIVEGRGFEPPSIPGSVWGEGRLLAPHLTGTDGMFVALHRA
jgi:16S rRNA C967 or C1407 C5-methylase (RsmB/RsmF family)